MKTLKDNLIVFGVKEPSDIGYLCVIGMIIESDFEL